MTPPSASGAPRPAPPDWSGQSPQTLLPVEPQSMTDWYSPRQLAATALQVVVSTLLGRHADHRAMEALASGPCEVCDFSAEDTFVFDYVADTGDGWDSTYTVAYHAALAQLSLGTEALSLPRGEVLILGGDEVYPVPSRAQYERRLVGPFETAMAAGPDEARAPHVFAIPGNHDWYDSLAAFTRLFIDKEWFAAWRNRQTRSYFALKLPQGWWLMGADVQLDSDLDAAQLAYFKQVAARIPAGDRIILCLPEPHWIYQQERDTGHWDRADWERPPDAEGGRPIRTNLDFLEQKVFRNQVAVMLAGDLHHYRRHAYADGRQKIVAGGGGAFLHASHAWSTEPLTDGAQLKHVWPPSAESRGLVWGNLAFPLRHKPLGTLIGLAYLMVTWTLQVDLSSFGFQDGGAAFGAALLGTLRRPGGALLVLGLLGAFILFAAREKARFQWIAGTLHGMGHLLLCFLLGWGATRLTVAAWGWPFLGWEQLLLGGLLVFLGGAVFGTLLFGFYLAVSLNVFRFHWNEASSGLALPDWKHFLRLRIGSDGALTIFPIGFRRVPRRWRAGGADPARPRLEPDDPRFSGPELIEPPIRVPGRARP